MGFLFFGGPEMFYGIFNEKWLPLAIGIGVLFIITFVLMAWTVQTHGIVIATIFQKMSLLAPAILGISFYGESTGPIKTIGILLALVSIIILGLRPRRHQLKSGINPGIWLLPIGVFLGSCIIDSALYLAELYELVHGADVRFIVTIFSVAFLGGTISLLNQKSKKLSTINRKNIVAGVGLGIPNFFSIYLLLMVLSGDLEASVVFPINNIGILLLSSIFGLVFFKEHLSTVKATGLSLALISIILISNG
jgi:drug/metabolite transporter (DMT)-like permease